MLPSPAEVRERARSYLDAASNATDPEAKSRLAACAFVMAQVAEAIERDEEGAKANVAQLARVIVDAIAAIPGAPVDVPHAEYFVRRANIERYERLLVGELDPRTRSTVEALLAQENAAEAAQRRQIGAWRRRAEELRTTADNFTVPSAQESLRRAADNFDKMAEHKEAILTGKPKARGEETG